MKWGGRIYNGVINALPDQPAAIGRQAARNAPSGYADAAAGAHLPLLCFVSQL